MEAPENQPKQSNNPIIAILIVLIFGGLIFYAVIVNQKPVKRDFVKEIAENSAKSAIEKYESETKNGNLDHFKLFISARVAAELSLKINDMENYNLYHEKAKMHAQYANVYYE